MVFDRQEEIAAWVAEMIGIRPFHEYKAMGMEDEKGFLCGVVYDRFSMNSAGEYEDCAMHVAARSNSKWCTREFLKHAFGYPFKQLSCARVTGLVKAGNEAARRLDEHLGFVQEGILRKGMDGNDLILYGMLKQECKWI